ncbi:MAG: hypothetical protein ACJA1A_000176 [Saprospiraceae bacterium]|jgi:hypothetical protein
MKMKFTATLDKFDDSLYPYHVKVPQAIYQTYTQEKIKRILVIVDGGTQVHNAFLSKDGFKFIKLNKKTMAEKGLKVGDKIEVLVEEDKSKYGVPIALEMKELLVQDVEGEVLFHKLTPGKIRSLLFKINNYKTTDKRIETSIIILEHLKANSGKLDWKMLNEGFKIGFKL